MGSDTNIAWKVTAEGAPMVVPASVAVPRSGGDREPEGHVLLALRHEEVDEEQERREREERDLGDRGGERGEREGGRVHESFEVATCLRSSWMVGFITSAKGFG